MISAGCQTLEYFTNNEFVFNAYNYNAALDRLNETDKKMYFSRAAVCLNSYSESLFYFQFEQQFDMLHLVYLFADECYRIL